MSLWNSLNNIEQHTWKATGVASMLKILAEQTTNTEQSEVLWLCSDVLNERSEAISLEIIEAMKYNKIVSQRVVELEAHIAKLTKGKKK